MKKTPSVIGIGGAEAASSILTQQNGEYSLYFHIPFCSKKCDYCHFYVIPDQTRFKELYMQALQMEWEMRSPLLPPHTPLSIYFGGGTPALLAPSAIEKILSWIAPHQNCEVTLEANPENVTLELMQAFKASGVNRVSLGVQTLDDHLLKLLSRTHSAQHCLEAVEATARAGIDNLSIDLMYDLPEQTLSSWQKTLSQALSLPITHFSLYNLTLEPHTVFFKKRKTLKLPDGQLSLTMLETAVDAAQQRGFSRYEISAFAKEGKTSCHNIGYWTARPFLGFGPSAFSYWNGSRMRNIANLNRYAKALSEKNDPMDFQEHLPDEEKSNELLSIRLRLLEGTPLSLLPESLNEKISQLEEMGLMEKTTSHLRLTAKGLLFHDTVAEHLVN